MGEILSVEGAAGQYDVLPARSFDGAVPEGATHCVYHEDGGLVGFASDTTAWQSDERGVDVIGSAASLGEAARMVAEVDGELFGVAADGADFRGVDGSHACGLAECDCHLYAGNVDPNQPGHGDMARCTETAPCGDSGCDRCAEWPVEAIDDAPEIIDPRQCSSERGGVVCVLDEDHSGTHFWNGREW
jgi:hypothetical protein